MVKMYEMAISPPHLVWVSLVYGVYLTPLSKIVQSYRGC